MTAARMLVLPMILLTLSACATAVFGPDDAALKQQVADTERAFAKTMADRDHTAFKAFLSDDTVFFGSQGAQRGKATVAKAWERFFLDKQAPFSWEPAQVEVLNSGDLALTSGPVHDPAGKLVGTFTSIWRREESNTWRIVFDKGCDVCEECPKEKKK